MLAVLSVIEFAFPRLKWLTFPAMIVSITFLVGLHFFHRCRAVSSRRGSTPRLGSGTSPDGEPGAPIEPE